MRDPTPVAVMSPLYDVAQTGRNKKNGDYYSSFVLHYIHRILGSIKNLKKSPRFERWISLHIQVKKKTHWKGSISLRAYVFKIFQNRLRRSPKSSSRIIPSPRH
jgi:hypothetical protein